MFRQPYMARQVKVTFEAEDVPAFGYCTCYLEEADAAGEAGAVEEMAMAAVCESESAVGGHSLTPADRVMENGFLRVEIHGDGSYSVTDKESGKRYPHVGYYEECGDIGNEYIFIQDSGKEEITTQGTEARIELIEDEPFSPFPTVANSEKPDKVVAKLLEGRVGIMVDGTPFVLTVPTLFVESFQSAEDYSAIYGEYGALFALFCFYFCRLWACIVYCNHWFSY